MTGTAEERIKKRRERLLQLLPTEMHKSKTIDEITELLDYSSSTIRKDLGELRAAGIVEVDASRKPHKWWKTESSRGS